MEKVINTTYRMVGAIAQTRVNMVDFDKEFRSVRKGYQETRYVSFLNGTNTVLESWGIAQSMSSVKSFNKMRSSLSSKRITSRKGVISKHIDLDLLCMRCKKT
ncbi:MAG: hypothetical protein HDR01_10865 [Lachnospiraceae bacterium]|nr:hypothetical protein [Lachnospiraceae bacterium]